MKFNNVLSFYQGMYAKRNLDMPYTDKEIQLLDSSGDTYRIERVDPELTRKLNRKLGVQNQFLVMDVYDYQETRYRPAYHVVYFLTKDQQYFCKTRFVVDKEKYLNPFFVAYNVSNKQFYIQFAHPDHLPKERIRILQMHLEMKNLLFQTNTYRLQHITGGLV